MSSSTTTIAAAPRTARLAAAGYIALMAGGMAVMHHGFAFRYGEAEMALVLGPVEVLLTLWALGAARRQGGLAAAGFGRLRPGALGWLAPLAVPLAIGLWSLAGAVAAAPPGRRGLLLAVAATTALVGLSEELMFRGVLLRGAWRGHGLYRAMLESAVGFMLLHAVNVLGGSPPAAVAGQLLATFLFGLALAPVAIRLGSLWPIASWHALWDFSLFGHAAAGAQPPPVVAILWPILVLLAAAGWWSLRGARHLDLAAFEAGGQAGPAGEVRALS